MSQYVGGCLCGKVRYQVTQEPLVSRVCWCSDCQRISANGTVNMAVATEALVVTGELKKFTRTADSGNQIDQHFCPQCGVHIYASAAARPTIRIVRVGSLDNPSQVKPTVNIWTASAPHWACLDGQLEGFPGQAPPPTALAK